MSVFFNTVISYLYTALNTVLSVFSGISVFDIIDILLLTLIIYKIIEFCKDSRAKTILKGIFLILIMYALSIWLKMTGINWILEKIVNYGVVILVIVFQPELRRALENFGHSSFGIFGGKNIDFNNETSKCLIEVCKAVADMSKTKTGALIVFENKTPLGEIINTGTEINANVSVPMLCNIFFPKSPLHDGAVIIKDNCIKAAACILPLSSNQNISQELGTRHRAAVGISENSDSVTVIVSEETGDISVTNKGEIKRHYNQLTLQQELFNIFIHDEEQPQNAFASIISGIKKHLPLNNQDKGSDNNE